MKLFIINNVLNDYTPGMVIIKAESLDRARELYIERFVGGEWDIEFEKEFDVAVENKDYSVFDIVDGDETDEGFVKVMFGAG